MATTDREIVKAASADGKNPWARRLLLGLIAAFLVFFIGGGIAVYYVYNYLQDYASQGANLAQRVQEACADDAANTDGLDDLCNEADTVVDNAPSVVIPGPQGEPGEDGEDGRDGSDGANGSSGTTPSANQIELAVLRYCNEGLCQGPQGENGRSATATDVQAAVELYCDANGECRGEGGATGSSGSQGIPGPPPSAEQVAAAVVSYCSTRNECRGPTGAAGAPGAAGAAGRGIEGIACEATGATSFIITYTDGTSEEIECTPEPLFPIDPDPTEEVTP